MRRATAARAEIHYTRSYICSFGLCLPVELLIAVRNKIHFSDKAVSDILLQSLTVGAQMKSKLSFQNYV